MTANRWWVKIAARWLARIDGVSGQLRLGFQGMAGVSAALGAIKYYGFGQLAPVFLVVVGAVILLYTYLYTEGGVWNQMARDRQDMSTNYAPPTMLMDDVCIGIGAFVAMNGREPDPEEVEMMETAVRDQWEEYRDGVEIQQ